MYRRFIKTLSLVLSCVMVICNIQVTHIHAEEQYQHSETATSGSVTMKVEWNDPVLGQPTTFHLSATGGSGAYKFRMDAPIYSNPNEWSFESVADPSRGGYDHYTSECTSTDYSFTMMASGTYNFRFYIMDQSAGVYYLRTSTNIQVSDPNYPSVNSLIQSAVAQCNKETDGSDYQKALWLHDWLLEQLDYDTSLEWCSAESALTRHLGTCQAYESAYAQLLRAAGIENMEVSNTTDGHTWNGIKIDGEWYQVDCTWDDSSNNYYNFDQRHLYFGLTDELMAIAHPGHTKIYTTEGYGARSTNLENNYFVKSGEAQQWVESYRDRIQNSLNSKQTQFSIQADNSTYPPSIYKIQNGIISYVMNQNDWFVDGKKVSLVATVNDNKFDFTVTYPTECTKHDWNEGKVTTEPTCTKEGIKTYTCKNCATTKTETINALGHDYSNDWTIDKAATCTQEGSKSHHCTRCDDKKDVTTIPKTDHHFDNGVITKQATTTETGLKTYTCQDCKTTKSEIISVIKNNDTVDSEAPVIDVGSIKFSKDSATVGDTVKISVKITDNVGINESVIILENYETGKKIHLQKGIYNENTKKYEYSLDINDDIPNGHWYISSIQARDKADNLGIETFQQNEYSFIVMRNNVDVHKWNDGKILQQATCTKQGLKEYTCLTCNKIKTETIKALGHDYSNNWTIDKTATCTQEGSKSHHCTRCNDKKDVTVIPKLNHNWDSGVETTKATCTQSGVKTYTCKNCATTKTETIKALGHDYSNDWTIDKAATCTQEGSKSHHCTRCDDKKDVTVIPKTGHNWNSGVETTKATCTQSGVKTYTCKDCKTTKTEKIKALGHNYSSDWIIDKAATCTQEGSKSHHCTRCSAKKDVTVIPKTSHNWSNWSIVEQATTKNEGKERRTCRACNAKEERSIAKLKVETQSMYRLYNPNSGEHFYTANAVEKNHLAIIGWIYEGIGWIAPKTSDYPVYRIYNGNGGEHHYTMNKAEKDMLVRAGWKYECVGWYSADPKDSNSIPLLREYNPNAFANNHNYTTSKPEHNWLISLGWKDEGKAWYALNK